MIKHSAALLAVAFVFGGGLGAGAATAQQTPDFVESGVDPATYVARYLNEAEFALWYDTYYPDLPLHEALQLSIAEYDEIVTRLTAPQCGENEEIVDGACVEIPSMCGKGTMLVDGECVPEPEPPLSKGAAEYRAQGSGLQLGVAAAAAFGAAIIIVLFLWLPSQMRKRIQK